MSTTANSGDDVDASDLEELVAALREQNEQLIERVEALEERQGGDDKGGGGRGRPTISRREAIVGGGLLGLLGLGATPTLAQDVSLRDNCRWFADNDADGHGLYNLGLLHGSVTGGKELLDLEGTGLEIDANGQLTVTGGGGGGTPGGSDTQLQYNDGGAFGGIPGLTYDDVAGELSAVPAIADHLVPDADATRDLGAAGTRWRDIYGETVTTGALTVGGGLLYEEDDNSPFEFTGESSQTFTLSQNFSHVVVLYDTAENIGVNQLQVNGGTGSNYEFVDNSDTQSTGQTEWTIPYSDESAGFELIDGGNKIAMKVSLMSSRTGQTIAGKNENLGGNGINQFTVSDSAGSNRTFRARVYGRNLS